MAIQTWGAKLPATFKGFKTSIREQAAEHAMLAALVAELQGQQPQLGAVAQECRRRVVELQRFAEHELQLGAGGGAGGSLLLAPLAATHEVLASDPAEVDTASGGGEAGAVATAAMCLTADETTVAAGLTVPAGLVPFGLLGALTEPAADFGDFGAEAALAPAFAGVDALKGSSPSAPEPTPALALEPYPASAAEPADLSGFGAEPCADTSQQELAASGFALTSSPDPTLPPNSMPAMADFGAFNAEPAPTSEPPLTPLLAATASADSLLEDAPTSAPVPAPEASSAPDFGAFGEPSTPEPYAAPVPAPFVAPAPALLCAEFAAISEPAPSMPTPAPLSADDFADLDNAHSKAANADEFAEFDTAPSAAATLVPLVPEALPAAEDAGAAEKAEAADVADKAEVAEEVEVAEVADAPEAPEVAEAAEVTEAPEAPELDAELQQARAERELMERELMERETASGAFDEFGSFELPELVEASDSFSKIGAAVTDDEFNELFGPTE